MSFPIFRFTLSNDVEGDLEITEPGGWDDGKIKLERNEKYHSLVEFYEQPLTFYGVDSTHNGGLEYINTIRESQGPDADISILIEVNFGSGYETLFTGLLDLSQYKDFDDYKADIPVIREDFWTKFINRSSTPVDVQSALSIDGNAVDVITPLELSLTSQVLPKFYTAYANESTLYFEGANWTVNSYIQFDMNIEDLSEIKTKYFLPRVLNPSIPGSLFSLEDDGDYVFDLRIEASGRVNSPLNIVPGATYVTWYIQINGDAAIAFTESTEGTGSYQSTVYTYSDTLSLLKGDQIYIYGDIIADIAPLGTDAFYQIWSTATAATPAGYGSDTDTKPSYWNIEGQTTYTDTITESLLIHDMAESILNRTCETSVYSDYLGGSLVTSDNNYETDGCGYPFTLMKGLHLRQYSFTDKPFFSSFDDLWNGIDPVFCLGLGYEVSETSPNENIIRIEQRSHFYDSSINSINLDYINNIEKSYATDRIFKKIEIGYQKWESENISGIDDPQTKHTYATGFRKIGEEIELYSKCIAASYAIESTRRQVIEKSKDYRLDNDTFIIAVNPATSPVVPELDENFTSVTGLNNSDTRYNLRITPYWNFTNWVQFFSSSFRPLNSAYWSFMGGEGNYAVQYVPENQCLIQFGSGSQGEGDDISVSDLDTDGYMFALDVWEFEHPLSWSQYKTIRDNRKNSIGLSTTNADHQSFFILSLEYEITKRKAKFKCLKAGVDAPPPAIDEGDFLLTESSDLFALEDDSGYILLE